MKRSSLIWGILVLIMMLGISVPGSAQQRNPRAQNVREQVIPLTQEEEDEALNLLKETDPRRYEQILQLKASNPLAYQRIMNGFARQFRNLTRIKANDPETYERILQERRMDRDCRDLAEACKTADSDEKKRIEIELKEKLNVLFDLRQENRELEIKRLEERLEELKEKNRLRIANKQEIVESRFQELLGKSSGLEW
jgi:hypothetical protein